MAVELAFECFADKLAAATVDNRTSELKILNMLTGFESFSVVAKNFPLNSSSAKNPATAHWTSKSKNTVNETCQCLKIFYKSEAELTSNAWSVHFFVFSRGIDSNSPSQLSHSSRL